MEVLHNDFISNLLLGKFPAVDQGYSLPLGLLARGETLMDLGDYHFALADLQLASEEKLPQNARSVVN